MSLNEIERLESRINGYILMKSFLSTSFSSEVAEIYSGKGERRPLLESVIFVIQVDFGLKVKKPYAPVTSSPYQNELELLFDAGSVFQIKDVLKWNDDIWVINLILKDIDPIFDENYLKNMVEHIAQECGGKSLEIF